MQLFPASGGYVSLWAARSLPAVLGVVSIPAVYGLGWLAFRSLVVAQLVAALMAVCPYGVFLTQEARHYALGTLWVIASLSCLVVAVEHLKRRTPLPIWVALCWVVVNALGIATHYFFSLTLCAEAIALMGFWILGSPWAAKLGKLFPIPDSRFPIPHSTWLRIYAVAAGTGVGCLVWVPVWRMSHDTQMTQWIMSDNRSFFALFNPIFQAIGTWITMLVLLPVESPRLLVVVASGLVTLIFFRGTDLTGGAQYNFVYFPAVIVLLGAALAVSWKTPKTWKSSGLLKTDHAKPQIPEADWGWGIRDRAEKAVSTEKQWESRPIAESEKFFLSP